MADLAPRSQGLRAAPVQEVTHEGQTAAFIHTDRAGQRATRRAGSDEDSLRTDTARLHDVLEKYGITAGFEQYPGTHTSRVADRFQNHVLPFFGERLCFDAACP
jgi:enterochelin esterase-like enzyme